MSITSQPLLSAEANELRKRLSRIEIKMWRRQMLVAAGIELIAVQWNSLPDELRKREIFPVIQFL